MQLPLVGFFGTAPRRAAGFTLVELLVVLTVLGVLLALGIPSFAGLVQRWRLESAVNTLTGDLRLARSTATRTSRPITLCARNGPGQCSGGPTWTAGWLVFVDVDNDEALDADETVITERGPPAGLASMTFSTGQTGQFRFRPNGTLFTPPVTVTVRTAGPDPKQQSIVINAIGRVYVSAIQ